MNDVLGFIRVCVTVPAVMLKIGTVTWKRSNRSIKIRRWDQPSLTGKGPPISVWSVRIGRSDFETRQQVVPLYFGALTRHASARPFLNILVDTTPHISGENYFYGYRPPRSNTCPQKTLGTNGQKVHIKANVQNWAVETSATAELHRRSEFTKGFTHANVT